MEPCSTSIPIIEGVSLAVGGDVGAPARSMATSDRSMAASVAADEREELLISAGLAIDTKARRLSCPWLGPRHRQRHGTDAQMEAARVVGEGWDLFR